MSRLPILDMYLDDEADAPSTGPTFVHGMRVELIEDQVRDVSVDYEDADGRVYECVVSYDGDTVAWVTGYDERGRVAEFSDNEREAIVAIAARKL